MVPNTVRIRLILLLLVAGILVSPSSTFALSLEQAKSQGIIGERPDGYLGIVQNENGAQELVSKTNALRKEKYQQIAKKNGTPLAAVEKLAGEKAIEKTERGHYYIAADGGWKRK
jgi:uncharacterized protein